MIVQELLRLQDTFGYLPRKQLAALANRLSVPLYRVHEVATFFPHFTVELPNMLRRSRRRRPHTEAKSACGACRAWDVAIERRPFVLLSTLPATRAPLIPIPTTRRNMGITFAR